jgi:hypothetical protein
MHQLFALGALVVPAVFASCSDDETSSGREVGGDGQGESGDAAVGDAGRESGGTSSVGGEPSAAGASGSASSPAGGQTAGGVTGAGGVREPGAGGLQGDAGDRNGAGGEPARGGEGGVQAGGGEGGTPATLAPVIVFDAGPHDGLDFDGRPGLDQHCATAKLAKSIKGSVTHALISVSAADELRDMPALYGLPTDRSFVGPTGKKIADDFADLLDGSLDQSLNSADVSAAEFWISGSNVDGSVRKTCNGWTSAVFSQDVTGSYGYPNSADSSWLTVTGGDVYCSASQYTVICVAFD